MLLIILLGIAAATACCSFTITRAVRRRRTPPALRGDWWPDFEAAFRAYVAQQAGVRRTERG